MPRDDDLLPLKRVLELVGVSRSTLWRVSASGIEGFPRPKARGRRLFWREEDLPALRQCIDAFDGRTVFDRRKEHDRRRRKTQHAALAAQKRGKVRSRRPKSSPRKPAQGDLFGV